MLDLTLPEVAGTFVGVWGLAQALSRALGKVLGGGLLSGSLILLGGNPGVGKSTLALHLSSGLKIKEVYTHEKNKLNRLNYLAEKYNLKSDNIAYIGDDINDLEALKFAGLSAAPPNAPILDYFKPDFITNRNSGMGSFRDLSDS